MSDGFGVLISGSTGGTGVTSTLNFVASSLPGATSSVVNVNGSVGLTGLVAGTVDVLVDLPLPVDSNLVVGPVQLINSIGSLVGLTSTLVNPLTLELELTLGVGVLGSDLLVYSASYLTI